MSDNNANALTGAPWTMTLTVHANGTVTSTGTQMLDLGDVFGERDGEPWTVIEWGKPTRQEASEEVKDV